MNNKNNWQGRYLSGDLPWDTGRYDFNLKTVVTKHSIKPCKSLEIGCGTGSNTIWLAQQGFSVTAIDIAEAAMQKAIAKISKTKLRCKFFTADILKQKIKGAPFSFVFDRGCFHSFNSAKARSKYAKIIHSYLKINGLWLTLIGSADQPPRNPGPPQLSAKDISTAVEPYFEILSLYSSHFDSKMKNPPKIWVCLMKKRASVGEGLLVPIWV